MDLLQVANLFEFDLIKVSSTGIDEIQLKPI